MEKKQWAVHFRIIIGPHSLPMCGSKCYCCAAKPTDIFPKRFHRNISWLPCQPQYTPRVSCLRKPKILHGRIKERTMAFSVSNSGRLSLQRKPILMEEEEEGPCDFVFFNHNPGKIQICWEVFASHLHLALSVRQCEWAKLPASLS